MLLGCGNPSPAQGCSSHGWDGVQPKAVPELSLRVKNRAGKAKLIFVYFTDLALLLKHFSVAINPLTPSFTHMWCFGPEHIIYVVEELHARS